MKTSNTTKEKPTEFPSVSVIIPHYNDSRIELCVAAIVSQSYSNIEIVVVDNGSDEFPPPSLAKYRDVVVLQEKKAGSYAARNCGIEGSSGDIVAFTDSDCIPSQDWIRHAVEVLATEETAGFVGGPVELFAAEPDRPTAAEALDMVIAFPQQDHVEKGGFSATANMVTRRSTIEKMGPFNDQLKSGGDREWGQRVTAAGNKGTFCEGVLVWHPARATLNELLVQARRHTGGNVQRGKLPNEKKRGPLRLLARLTIGSLSRLKRVLVSDKVRGWLKFRVCFVFIYIETAKYFERCRLYFGGTAERN